MPSPGSVDRTAGSSAALGSLLLATGLLAGAASAAPGAFEVPPAPPRFVHDGAGLLDSGERRALEDKLLSLQREHGLEIGVAILPGLSGEPLEDTTLRIAEAWRPGRKGQDTGILIALFLAERKLRIEVGYGLEGAVPDVLAGRILRNVMVPEMRAGRPAGALNGAVEALAAAARGETLPEPVRRRSRDGLPLALVVLLLLWFPSIWARAARRQARRGRGLGRHGSIPWWIPGPGGGWGGGGGWSGGSSGGGSFGGGSFGGGGASGGW